MIVALLISFPRVMRLNMIRVGTAVEHRVISINFQTLKVPLWPNSDRNSVIFHVV